MRRLRAPRAKPGELKAQWGKLPHGSPDLCYAWGEGTSVNDGHLLHNALTSAAYSPIDHKFEKHGFLEKLEERGYDITTLKFSIQKTQATDDRKRKEKET